MKKKFRPAVRSIALSEKVVYSGKQIRVDRDAGIIHDVKIIGTVSANGRVYLMEALKSSIPLYEGVLVNIDHPKRPTDSRAVSEMFGKLINVRVEQDGLYGDLHFLKTHPLAEQICEAAERFPDKFGLSHNAQADGIDSDDGTFVVQKITEVRSVDVVSSPATTAGLFEQTRRKPTMKKRLTSKALILNACNLLESAKGSKPADKRKARKARAFLEAHKDDGVLMTEDDPMYEEGEDGEMEDGEPEDMLWDGFKQAICAILEDPDLDAKEKTKKVGEYLKAHERLGMEEEPEDDLEEEEEETEESKCMEEEDEEEKPKEKEDEKVKEQKELRRLRKKEKVRDMLEQHQIPSEPELVRILMATADKLLPAAIEREKRKVKASSPRSGNLLENRSSQTIETVEGLLSALRGGN
jgi:hypothetical protein